MHQAAMNNPTVVFSIKPVVDILTVQFNDTFSPAGNYQNSNQEFAASDLQTVAADLFLQFLFNRSMQGFLEDPIEDILEPYPATIEFKAHVRQLANNMFSQIVYSKVPNFDHSKFYNYQWVSPNDLSIVEVDPMSGPAVERVGTAVTGD